VKHALARRRNPDALRLLMQYAESLIASTQPAP